MTILIFAYEQREGFRSTLPQLLAGEDKDFAEFMREMAERKTPR